MTTVKKSRKRFLPDYNAGDIAGKWTILKEDPSQAKGRAYLCRCACGNERVATLSNLLLGKSTQCKSCQVRQVNIKNRKHNFFRSLGEIIGKWTVLKETKNKQGQLSYLCKCVCGFEKVTEAHTLFNGRSKQCSSCRLNEKRTIHQTKSPIYKIWSGLRGRCNNPRNREFYAYGGRGIKVCERWNKFENFSADMGERPERATLDRIDPDGDYEPENCRWVTPQENLANRRNSAKYRGLYIYVKKEKLCEECLKKVTKI